MKIYMCCIHITYIIHIYGVFDDMVSTALDSSDYAYMDWPEAEMKAGSSRALCNICWARLYHSALQTVELHIPWPLDASLREPIKTR